MLARRSSFGPELLATCGAADGLQQRLLALRETGHGPASAGGIGRLQEEGGWAIPAELVVDCMSVFAALLMDPVKPPSENSMAGRLWWPSDHLRTKQIEDVPWCDTRDMKADLMINGSIRRELILGVMGGHAHYAHLVVRYTDEKAKRTIPSSRHSELTKKRSAVDDEMGLASGDNVTGVKSTRVSGLPVGTSVQIVEACTVLLLRRTWEAEQESGVC